MKHYLSIVLILALALIACRAVQGVPDSSTAEVPNDTPGAAVSGPQTTPPAGTGTPEAGAAQQTQAAPPENEPEPTAADPAPTAGEPLSQARPPQSQAAEIRPPDRRAELTRLSNLLGFQVSGQDGALLGTAADFIINTCETYLIYFVLDPAETLNIASGSHLIVPYEVVTINSGALDAQAGAIVLSLTPGQVAAAPGVPASLELFPTDWEAGVRDYWSQVARISNLTTECRVAAPGGGTVAIQKIAYATELLGAELKDGLQTVLGTVEEAILAPESGKLAFFVVNLQDGQGLVLVPLRVVNIPNEALEPGAALELVLLTENERLLNAPRINSLEEATQDPVQGAAIQHWGQ